MNKYFFRQLTVLILGLLLTNVAQTFGQLSDTPPDNKVDVPTTSPESPHKGALYEHEYYSGGQDATREEVDSVMVTSVMNYFVMPDKNYNTAYFAQSSYTATNLTSSEFVWTVTGGTAGTAVAQTPNIATGTSPWVKITWNTVGDVTLTVQEVPQGADVSCVASETEIDVAVIARPTIEYRGGNTASACYDDTNVATAEFDFPVTFNTSSSQGLVDVTITKDGVAYDTVTDVEIEDGVFNLKFSDYGTGGYGTYVVTITKVTDRIARKCDVLGIVNDTSGANVFTYSVLPQPKTGPIYHVPNLF